ncbi:hypothetical protein CD30_12485 [Ureibacillus massiliensis 4400831 = CIP 108448 = CCUG 49529]|uniref:Uncharacterized protein n=1 Tax=Ureibacillus massiliensis 4400831 = CIP 108448 = CCUG 49529 TaxID=1211035 RepID=A0A0A3J579_9BACL|nr:hypothetical protein [Ureibacillus massiliensis]KGR90278.1 hypothetical protein CD30_12485 [Ureibacillus massiliensis 4400831 = CIP 108448 = CCUG 49529]
MSKILELELNVSDISHRVNRIIEVEEESTFDHLSEIIQIAFNSLEFESFLFEVKRSNGQDEKMYIGVDFDGSCIKTSSILDDEEEILADWFKKIDDYANFKIDSDKDLNIQILFKKIKEENIYIEYPRCIGGEGHLDGSTHAVNIEEISEQLEFVNFITDEFVEEFMRDLNIDDEMEDPKTDWRDLFEVADELKKLKPWEYLDNNQTIVVEHPESKTMLYICVMGAGGQEFGLSIYLDDKGRKTMENMQLDKLQDDFLFNMECLNVTFVDRDELTNDDYQLIKSLGLTFRGKRNWIQFRSYTPGKFPWIPNDRDADFILFAMLETIEVVNKCKNGWEFPSLPIGDYYFRRIEFVNDTFQVVEHIITFNEKENQVLEPILVDISELEIKQLAKKKVEQEELEFDLLYMPQAVQENPGERPFYPLLVIGMSRSSGMVIYQQMLSIAKDSFVAQIAFIEMLKSLTFKPSTVYVSEGVYSTVANLSKAINVPIKAGKLIAIADLKSYMEMK